MLIITDTREPAHTWFTDRPHIRRKLCCGDFSFDGGEHLVGIERKSVPDLVCAVGRARVRVENMLRRWRCASKWVVVEGTLTDVEVETMKAIGNRRVTIAHVIGAVRSWAMRYQTHTWFAPSVGQAEEFALGVLTAAERHALEAVTR